MEIAVSIVVIAVSLCLILLLYFQKSRRDSYGDYLSLSGVLLGLWFISCSVFNTYFFSFRFAGLFDLSVERVLLCALVLIMLLRIYRGQAAHGIDYSILLLIFLFSLTCVISMSVNGFEAITPEYPKPWFVFFSGYMIPFFVYLFVVMIIKSESEIYFIFTCLFLFGVYLTITAFLEHYNLKFLVFPQYITSKLYPLHLDRARGPFLNSAFDGLAINQGFLAGLYLLNSSKTRFKSIIVILMLLFPPALFFCRTRSAYLIFLFILAGCFFVFKTRFVKWKMVPIIFCFAFVFLAANADKILSQKRETGGIYQVEEVNIRYALIAKSKRLIEQNPFSGVGLGHFSSASKSTGEEIELQHNHLIGMTVELGIFGVAIYLFVMILVVSKIYKLADYPAFYADSRFNVLLIIFLGITLNLVNNTFVEPALFPYVGATTFLYAGIADKYYQGQLV